MTRTDHLLVCLAEECAEVAQRASKALRFGLEEVQLAQKLNNAQRIMGEWIDLIAVMQMLQKEGALPPLATVAETDAAIERKKARVEEYLLLSKSQGRLD